MQLKTIILASTLAVLFQGCQPKKPVIYSIQDKTKYMIESRLDYCKHQNHYRFTMFRRFKKEMFQVHIKLGSSPTLADGIPENKYFEHDKSPERRKFEDDMVEYYTDLCMVIGLSPTNDLIIRN